MPTAHEQPAIVPRWELRAFGASLGAAEAQLRSRAPARVEQSRDVYVLSRKSDASVKVRDGLVDVKHLRHVDGDGLELWMPVLKAPFPLAPEDVDVVLRTLGAEVPRPERPADALDELLNGHRELRALEVDKLRAHHEVGGCRAELTELRADDRTTLTIAVESEDPERVLATARTLGLDGANTSMARGLKALVGFGGPRSAVIDVGTNSIKLHVAEHSADGGWHTVVDRADVTRLGDGLRDGRLAAAPIERTAEAIAAMAEEARGEDADAIVAVGTAGLRAAENAGELLDAVVGRCGVRIEIISGEDEARLAFRGATSALALPDGPLAVFDTGGGSSQFSFGRADRVDERFSVEVGAVRITERFGLDDVVDEPTVAAARAAIADGLERVRGHPDLDAIVGMGGAVTNLAAVARGQATYDPDAIHGTSLAAAEIDRQIELYRTRPADRRRRIPGLQPNRAEVILAGACVVRTILELLGGNALIVSDRGLRHGLLAERFGDGS